MQLKNSDQMLESERAILESKECLYPHINWERPYTYEEQEFFDRIYKKLPTIVRRCEVEMFTDGLLKASTLKRDDCVGRGPRRKIVENNGRVAYYKEDLIDYWIRRFGITIVYA